MVNKRELLILGIPKSRLNIPFGVPQLDADGKISPGAMPDIAISQVFVVASEAAMLLLDAQIGDVAKRTDLQPNQTFMLSAEPATTLGNWIVISDIAINFTTLLDTPNNYTGHANKWVKVNGTPDGLEFITHDKALHDALLIDAATLDTLDSTSFAILAGQVGGQILNGGTTNADDIILQANPIDNTSFIKIQGTAFPTPSVRVLAQLATGGRFLIREGPGNDLIEVSASTTNFHNRRSENMADPTAPQDGATKNYVDNILTSKAGSVAPGSFVGNPKQYAVVFNTPYASAAYSIAIIGGNARTWSIINKTVNGFIINSNSNIVLTLSVLWTATPHNDP